MADTQVNRLREMMGSHPRTARYSVYIAPLKLKKSEIREMKSGDLWLLPRKRIDIVVEDSQGRILAEGEYGSYHDTPSVLINRTERPSSEALDSKKYKFYLGSFGKRTLAKGEIIPLEQEERHGVILYRSKKVLAHAVLAEADGRSAVKITEID